MDGGREMKRYIGLDDRDTNLVSRLTYVCWCCTAAETSSSFSPWTRPAYSSSIIPARTLRGRRPTRALPGQSPSSAVCCH